MMLEWEGMGRRACFSFQRGKDMALSAPKEQGQNKLACRNKRDGNQIRERQG